MASVQKGNPYRKQQQDLNGTLAMCWLRSCDRTNLFILRRQSQSVFFVAKNPFGEGRMLWSCLQRLNGAELADRYVMENGHTKCAEAKQSLQPRSSEFGK